MILEVKVKTNSKSQEVLTKGQNKYLVYLKNSPEDNKANLELIKLLKKKFNREIKILRGKTSKNKIIKVEDAH